MSSAVIIAQAHLDEAKLTEPVHSFCDRVRLDPIIGPIFDTRISDWGLHLERMLAFRPSFALMMGRYHGPPISAKTVLPVLFREITHEVCTPEDAKPRNVPSRS